MRGQFLKWFLKNKEKRMNNFPGGVLIIDDGLKHLETYKKPADISNSQIKKEFIVLSSIVKFFNDQGTSLFKISDFSSTKTVIKNIQKLRNIRIILLDLDLNNNGDVDIEDISFIKTILEISKKQFGYFYLIINSAHHTKWDEIKKEIIEDKSEYSSLVSNLSISYKKRTDITNKLQLYLSSNLSINLIYHFESELNKARDKAFSDFIDYDKETWQLLCELIKKESGELVSQEITNIFINILKQQLIGISYSVTPTKTQTYDSDILKRIYQGVNYSKNHGKALDKQQIWTGNLYRTNSKDPSWEYAIVITPECDIAQKKHLLYKIIYGIEINDQNFQAQAGSISPIIEKFNLDKGEIPTRKSIEHKIKNNNRIQSSLFVLPHSSINSKSIVFDYRVSNSILESKIKKWKLVLRINDPLITHILDEYSNLFNRKGLLSFPFEKMTLL